MAYRILFRRDTAANWSTNNPVLASGEPGYETNTGFLKMGDGETQWNDLSYFAGGSIDLQALNSSLIPSADSVYDLGATGGFSWRDLYLSGNSIYIGDAKLSAVGTSISVDTIIVGGPTSGGGVILSATGGSLTSDGGEVANTGNVKFDGSLIYTADNSDISIDPSNNAGDTGYIYVPGPSAANSNPLEIGNQLLGGVQITSNSNQWKFGSDGSVLFPNINGNDRTGGGNNLQFTKDNADQKIISTQDGTQSDPTVERLVISGGDSYYNGTNYSGEGGDIYLWAGRGQGGGDIKVDAGQGTEEGGTVKIRGGYASAGPGGFVEITSGEGGSGNGGAIDITSGQGNNGNGGFITIQGGYGTNQGGGIAIQAGNGGSAGGNISLVGSAGAWTFKQNGALAFPNGTEQTTAYEGGALSIIEVTYSELSAGITGSSLIPGAYYLITDFQTCYDVPEYNVFSDNKTGNSIDYRQGEIEPILVTATSANTISSTAHQPDYPNDRIQYDWTWNTTEITGGTGYGRISERIDEYNNRTDYDHRNIYFTRFQSYDKGAQLTGRLASYNSGATGPAIGNGTLFLTEVSTGDVLLFENQGGQVGIKVVSVDSDTELTVVFDPSFGSEINFTGGLIELFKSSNTEYFNEYKEVYIGQKIEGDWGTYLTFNLNGSAIHNYIGDYSKFYLNENGSNSGFLLANNVFYSDNSGNYSNTIGDRSYNNTGRYWFVRNTIAGRFHNNTIGQNGFYSNSIGEYFNTNIIKSSMWSNTICEEFEQNEIYQNFNDNQIANNFNQNIIYSDFYDNQIGLNFENNTIGDSGNLDNFEFYRNKIGNDFNNNKIRQYFQNNQIGNQFEVNVANGDFYKNVIGNEFNHNQNIGYDFYGNHIGNGFNYNQLIGDYFHDNQIGEEFNNNSTLYFFDNNKIGNRFEENTLGDTQYFNWDNTSIENLTARTYSTFYNSLYGGGGNNIGNVILGKELIMHDTVNDEYHKVKFTQWTQNQNGGGFSYERTKVYPNVEATVYFTKPNYSNVVDVIVEGSLEIRRGNNGGIYNAVEEGGWNQNVSPDGTQWNSIYTQDNNGQNGNPFADNEIGNQFKGNYILKSFTENNVGSFIGGNHFYGFTTSNNIGNYTWDNDFLGLMYNNTWKGDFHGNTIGDVFSDNSFDFDVYGNTGGSNFQSNQIGGGFEDNMIGDNFGYGVGGPQGNKIGNNFYDNTVGEYFYNNSIPDNFNQNTIGDYFQWNVVNTNIYSVDFTTNYGNIESFNWAVAPIGSLYYSTGNWTHVSQLNYGEGALGGDYTIEWWQKANSVSGGSPSTVMSDGASDSGIDIFYQNGNLILRNGGVTVTGEPTPGVWTHVAVVSDQSVLAVYYNGSSVPVSGNGGNPAARPGGLAIGRRGPTNNFQYFDGNITGIRITKGVVYSGSFTVPTKILQTTQGATGNINAISDPSTVLLLMNSQNAGTKYLDASVFGLGVTGYGSEFSTNSPGVQTIYPNGTYTGLTAAGASGSLGVNAAFNVTVSGGIVTGVTGSTGGKLYINSETLTISHTQVVGATAGNDITVTVTDVNTPSVYEPYTSQIFKRSDDVNRLSYYDANDILTIKNINE